MAGLPIVLNLSGKRCLIVGGGAVALRRGRALSDCGAVVTVVAPQVLDELAALPGVRVERRRFEASDLVDAALVVVATGDPAVNEAASTAARARGVLVNRADDGDAGDIAFAAHGRRGPISIAVHTSGVSASASATIRDELLAALDPAWPALLDVAAAYRERLQREVTDDARRRPLLLQLVDPRARAVLRDAGPDGLRRHYDTLLSSASVATPVSPST